MVLDRDLLILDLDQVLGFRVRLWRHSIPLLSRGAKDRCCKAIGGGRGQTRCGSDPRASGAARRTGRQPRRGALGQRLELLVLLLAPERERLRPEMRWDGDLAEGLAVGTGDGLAELLELRRQLELAFADLIGGL